MNSSHFSLLPLIVPVDALEAWPEKTPTVAMATILVLDLHGFQAIATNHPPMKLFELLNSFFSAAVSLIEQQRGIVEQYLGDGLLARFMGENSAARAAHCAQIIIEKLSTTYPLRIGINSGEIALGWLGSDSRKQYSSLGTAVNEAFALCKSANVNDVCISEVTQSLL